MIEDDASLLEAYLRFPDRLEAAIAGLGAADLDVKQDDDWTIRQDVQHLVVSL